MADPVRLYSPNPNAPNVFGAAPTPEPENAFGRLARALAQPTAPPVNALWGALPPQARSSYTSLVNALAELSPGAAVRDTLESSGQMTRNALAGDFWGSAGAGASMLTAMAGAVPLARGAPKAAEFVSSLDPRKLVFREKMQNNLARVEADYPQGAGYTPLVVVQDGNGMTILDGHNRAAVARGRGDAVDAVAVPRALYQHLKASGLDDMDIAHAAHGWAGQDDAARALRQQFPGTPFYKTEEKAAQIFEDFEDGTFTPRSASPTQRPR